MSRIDDDSGAERRAEEARIADKRAQERVKKSRTDEASAFDRALAARSGETNQKKAFQQSLEKPKAPEPQAPPRDPRASARQAAAPAGSTQEAAAAANKSLEHEVAEIGGQSQNQMDKDATARGAERRAPQGKAGQPSADKTPLAAARADARSAGEAKESQSASNQKGDAKSEETGQAAGAAAGKKGGGVKRAGDDDRDSGGKNKDQGSSKDNAPTAFRLPPAALMAPPPLARPKDAGGARMSSITKEIVDKIVSRVLVGQNAAGAAEFRIDLKSSVLKGLSIKVSGGRGKKIRAVFSGSDHEVLEALERSKSDLIDALEARGLKLEDLAFEET
ncbi:MAG TPA: flagellar hook-length control protein FliK [Myxococcales bacterium]|jgi:hypothetical protein